MKNLVVALMASTLPSMACASQAGTLSRVSIYSVESSQGGMEYMSASMSSTSRRHGGAMLRITTEEIGYATNARALLDGRFLNEISTVPLCYVKGKADPCNGRGKVVGFRRTWDASGGNVDNFDYVVIPNRLSGLRQVSLLVR